MSESVQLVCLVASNQINAKPAPQIVQVASGPMISVLLVHNHSTSRPPTNVCSSVNQTNILKAMFDAGVAQRHAKDVQIRVTA